MFIEKIKKELSRTLPGENVQWEMASSDRRFKDFPRVRQIDTTDAAVLVLLYNTSENPTTLFTRRAIYNGVHSGQISFPGGKKEKEDRDLYDTALRETSEETGVDSSRIKIVGRLTPLYIPVSNIEVNPVVGYYEGIPEFNSASREVEKLIEAPLSHFFKATAIRKGIFPVRGEELEISYFDFEGEVIWGATAMIFNEMLAVLRSAGFPAQV